MAISIFQIRPNEDDDVAFLGPQICRRWLEKAALQSSCDSFSWDVTGTNVKLDV